MCSASTKIDFLVKIRALTNHPWPLLQTFCPTNILFHREKTVILPFFKAIHKKGGVVTTHVITQLMLMLQLWGVVAGNHKWMLEVHAVQHLFLLTLLEPRWLWILQTQNFKKVLFYETFSVLGKLFLRSPNLQGMSILVIALEHCKVKGLVRQVKSPLFWQFKH